MVLSPQGKPLCSLCSLSVKDEPDGHMAKRCKEEWWRLVQVSVRKRIMLLSLIYTCHSQPFLLYPLPQWASQC